MPCVPVNGVELFYEVHGRGAPLLLASGQGGVAAYWHEQVEPFSRSYRVILYDQRGTGRSTHAKVDSIEHLALDTVALLDALEIDKVHYVGHSTGGAIGQVLAIEHPRRLRSLVIYASVTKSDSYRRRVWGLRRAVLDKLGPRAYAEMTTLLLYPNWWINDHHPRLAREEENAATIFSGPEIMASRIEAILAFDRAAELAKIDTPTLVLCALDDILTPPSFSRALAGSIPGAALVLMERGGHACSQTMAAEFNRHVLEFLDTCSRHRGR